MSTVRYARRPSPLTHATAGGVFSIGLACLVARGVDAFTPFTLLPPFDSITFVVSIVGVIGGGTFIATLINRALRQQIARLRAENAELRTDRQKLDTLLDAVKAADQQGEVNGVLIRKVMRVLQDQRANDDTQDIPRPRLHGINGGGSA